MSTDGANFNMAVTRYRGDTVAERFQLVDQSGLAIDITDRTFVLSVNALENPTDSDPDLYELTGEIVEATAGTYEFPLSVGQADSAAGSYFFNIKMTFNPDGTGNVIKTVGGGTWDIVQGI